MSRIYKFTNTLYKRDAQMKDLEAEIKSLL